MRARLENEFVARRMSAQLSTAHNQHTSLKAADGPILLKKAGSIPL